MPNACLRLMLQDQLADLQRMQVGRLTGFVQLARPHSAPLRRKGAAATAGHTAAAAAAEADPGDTVALVQQTTCWPASSARGAAPSARWGSAAARLGWRNRRRRSCRVRRPHLPFFEEDLMLASNM
ncbi:hypothetical protein DIPPA_30785 [Diplonema papillatum]|nr:hypothetical protein DIPPA_30785 [Diplonema papillatum]